MVVARAIIAAIMISFAAVALLSVLVSHVVRPRQVRALCSETVRCPHH